MKNVYMYNNYYNNSLFNYSCNTSSISTLAVVNNEFLARSIFTFKICKNRSINRRPVIYTIDVWATL